MLLVPLIAVRNYGSSCLLIHAIALITVSGSPNWMWSDAGVPGVAILGIDAAEAFAKAFQIVRDRYFVFYFFVLVAAWRREPHAERSPVGHRKFVAIHAVTKKCLRMQS